MRRLRIGIFLFTIGIFIFSCQKQHLPAQTNTSPIFYFNGLVGGTYTSLRAGVSNYYMYSSYTQDSNGVYNYTGNLKEFNCSSSCPPSIEFIINDYQKLVIGANETNIATSLTNGYYSYMVPGGATTAYLTIFNVQPDPSGSPTNFNIDFGDGNNTSLTGLPNDTLSHMYLHPGSYNPTISVTYTSGSGSLSSPLELGTPNAKIITSISPTDSGTTKINFIATTLDSSVTIISYNWDFGDGSPAVTTQNASHTYSANGIYLVTYTVKDNNGRTSINKLNVKTQGDTANNLTNYSATPYPQPNPNGLSNITIIYTDASGNTFNSNNALQPDSSFFHITSVADYQKNENGQSTKQLHVKFNCILYDSKNNPLVIKNGDAVIAVSYK